MSIKIGIGTNLHITSSGGSWTAYWATRTPSSLTLTQLIPSTIRLNWSNSGSGFDGTSIERSTDGVTYAEIDTVASGVVQYNDTGLTEKLTYYYRLRCYKGSNYSPYSNVASLLLFSDELILYITGLATPLSSGQKTKLETFIQALKTGLSIPALDDKFDVMYILAGETQESSLKNLIKNSHHITAVNSPTFTALEGFTGNSSSVYLNANYKPSTDAVNVLLNSASWGIYCRTDEGAAAKIEYSSGSTIYGYLRYTGDLHKTRVNCGGDYEYANTSAIGNYVDVRRGATSSEMYKNNVSKLSSAIISTSVGNQNLFMLCFNNAGSPAFYSGKQLAFAFMGTQFSAAEVTSIGNAIEAYMDSNGKGVIP